MGIDSSSVDMRAMVLRSPGSESVALQLDEFLYERAGDHRCQSTATDQAAAHPCICN